MKRKPKRERDPKPPSRRPAKIVVTVSLSATLFITAACASGHRRNASSSPAPAVAARHWGRSVPNRTTVVPTTTTVPRPEVAPLTGLPPLNAAQLSAPAVIVKIDNVDAARPQSGVNQADVVYEELVESGLTRLAAVFQSAYPASVGPVRSGRLTDIALADDLNHPALAFAGANGLFLPQLRAQPVDDIDIDNKPGLFFTVRSKPVPHNLYTNVAADAADDKPAGPPPALFIYRAPGTPMAVLGALPASQVTLRWPATTVRWTFNAATGLWSRVQDGEPDVDATGAPLTATNIVVQAVPYVTSAIANEPGSGPTPIPEGLLVGSGTAWILSGGAVVQCTWARASPTGVTTYTNAAGQPIGLAPGRTWVELTQAGTVPSIH